MPKPAKPHNGGQIRLPTQTGSSAGHYRRGDTHPVFKNRVFMSYKNGKEVWGTMDSLIRNKRKALAKGLELQAKKRNGKPKQLNYQTASKRGTWKWGHEHPLHKGRFFIGYRKCGREIWAKQEWIALANSRSYARKKKIRVEDPFPMITALYASCQRLNKIFGRATFSVDHIVPVSMGGEHSIQNLQIVPFKWNCRKGNRHSQRWRCNAQ